MWTVMCVLGAAIKIMACAPDQFHGIRWLAHAPQDHVERADGVVGLSEGVLVQQLALFEVQARALDAVEEQAQRVRGALSDPNYLLTLQQHTTMDTTNQSVSQSVSSQLRIARGGLNQHL